MAIKCCLSPQTHAQDPFVLSPLFIFLPNNVIMDFQLRLRCFSFYVEFKPVTLRIPRATISSASPPGSPVRLVVRRQAAGYQRPGKPRNPSNSGRVGLWVRHGLCFLSWVSARCPPPQWLLSPSPPRAPTTHWAVTISNGKVSYNEFF